MNSEREEAIILDSKVSGFFRQSDMSFFVSIIKCFRVDNLSSYKPLEVIFIRTVDSILNLCLLVIFLSGLFHIFWDNPKNVMHNWGVAAILLIPKLLLRYGHVWLASFLFIAIVNLILYFYSVVSGPSFGFQNFLLVTTVIPFIMGIDRKTLGLSMISIATATILYVTSYHNPFHITLPQTHWSQFHSYILLTVTVSVLIVILQRSHTEKKEAHDQEQIASFHTSRKASLAELSGAIAHELNNPLAIIYGKLEILQSQFDDGKLTNERLGRDLDGLRKSTDRMRAIIASMQDLLAGDEAVEKYNLSNVIYQAASLARHLNYQVELVVEPAGDELWVVGNSSQMTQAILNLMVNAMEAAIKNSPAWVRIISSCSPEGFVDVKIIDSGEGVAKENEKKIMEPFFSTKPPGRGAGLGLTIALQIIEAQNGKLTLDKLENPTTFLMRLPRAESRSARMPE